MPIITFNEQWMLYNSFLAFLALGFGYFFLNSENKYLKIIFGVLWILFLPNTIYIFTDLEHLIYQWPLLDVPLRIIVTLQYLILEVVGVLTFLVAFYPFEKIVSAVKFFKKRKTLAITIFNFFIAFGLVLGRVERINSWEVFTNPMKVSGSAIHVFSTGHLLGLLILFGILCNCIYFLFRDRVLYILARLSQVLD